MITLLLNVSWAGNTFSRLIKLALIIKGDRKFWPYDRSPGSCLKVGLLPKVVNEHMDNVMTRNNQIVHPLALGIALLLYVVLLPGSGVVAQPVRERLPLRELTYVVEPIVQGESSRLRVSLTFQGDLSGTTSLLLPLEWSDGVELYRAIRNMRLLSEDTRI